MFTWNSTDFYHSQIRFCLICTLLFIKYFLPDTSLVDVVEITGNLKWTVVKISQLNNSDEALVEC